MVVRKKLSLLDAATRSLIHVCPLSSSNFITILYQSDHFMQLFLMSGTKERSIENTMHIEP
jgi:hypothetical protein